VDLVSDKIYLIKNIVRLQTILSKIQILGFTAPNDITEIIALAWNNTQRLSENH
jgi:hypothetical protein